MPGPCTPWANVDDLCSPCDDYSFPVGLLEDSLDIASEILFELSGRQFAGICENTVRPCTRQAAREYEGPDGTFRVVCGCGRSRRCGCSYLPELTLGAYPIREITEVLVDGDILDPSLYRVDDYRFLVRLPDPDGVNPGWPCCQHLDRDTTELGTFSVEFAYGRDVQDAAPFGSPAGVRAAARLGCELALACSPESAGRCQLTQRVQQITRQGVTVVLDRLDAIKEDFTGLMEVDLFLQTVNPHKLRRRARVLSPDIGRHVRRTGTSL